MVVVFLVMSKGDIHSKPRIFQVYYLISQRLPLSPKIMEVEIYLNLLLMEEILHQ